MNKACTILLSSLLMLGCDDGNATEYFLTSAHNFRLVKELQLSDLEYPGYKSRLYQNTNSGNCYIQYNVAALRGSFSQVDCADFGVLTPEQISEQRKKQEQEVRDKEYQEYLKMKAKFEGENKR